MMAWTQLREAFWRDPYGFMTNVLVVGMVMLIAWAFTPWFPLRP